MSLADALDLLAKNKPVGDDVFRSILSAPETKYPAVRESIAAFQDALAKKRVVDKPLLVAHYVRVVAILVEQKQHIQHLSLPDWTSLVQILGVAYNNLSAGPRDRSFVKNVFDLFRSLALLLDAFESIDPECFPLVLDMCEDFCGPDPQRETSCHQFVMSCVRALTQFRFSEATDLGNRLMHIERPRQERLKREMFAFACLVPHSMDDLTAIGVTIVEAHEIEFVPCPELGLPWFRPSPEADLNRFIASKALASRATGPRATGPAPHEEGPPSKRAKTELGEVEIMACAFGFPQDIPVVDLLAWSGHSFWIFVVLAQRIPAMTREELLETWKVAIDHIRYAHTSSSACFCLSQLVPVLVDPTLVDASILARLNSLLVTMGESSYPELSSGSLRLHDALSSIRILDRDFQTLKSAKLRAWLTRSIARPPSSLITSLFSKTSRFSHIDIRGFDQLKGLETSQRLKRVVENLEPNAIDDPPLPYKPIPTNVGEGTLSLAQNECVDLRSCLWCLAVKAHFGLPILSSEHRREHSAVSQSDIQSIVWFANLAKALRWPRKYLNTALEQLEGLRSELLNAGPNLKDTVDLALALLEESDSGLAAFIAGHSESLENENSVDTIRSLQRIFQSYTLQRSPFVLCNILQLLDNQQYSTLQEYSQLVAYFKSFIASQSPYSRLRPFLIRLLSEPEDIVRVIAGSCLSGALLGFPRTIDSDQLALELLKSLDGKEHTKALSLVLMLRGASPAQLMAFLFENKLLYESDLDAITKLLSMRTSRNLIAAIAAPLLLGPFARYLQPLAELVDAPESISCYEYCNSKFFASPKILSNSETAVVVEDMMRNCSYLSSAEEKVECVSRSWLFLRAHRPSVSSEVLRTYIKSTVALAGQLTGRHLESLETILAQLLIDTDTVHAYQDLAADIAYMGFLELSKRTWNTFEAANSNVMRIFWTLRETEDDVSKVPVLIYELIRARDTTFEVWSLVSHELIRFAASGLKSLVDAIRASPRIDEIMSSLQLWTKRLNLGSHAIWMSLMGYLSTDVGNVLPKTALLGERSPHSFLRQLLAIYNGLPSSKKWHLHPFMRKVDNGLIEVLHSSVISDHSDVGPRPMYARRELVSPVYTTASRLANLALKALDLPLFEDAIFEEIPELIDNFLPLLVAAGLESEHLEYIEQLLSGIPEHRYMALRIMQRYYEATKSFKGIESAIIEACDLSGDEFSELGIACVEMIWDQNKEDLSKGMLEKFLKFHEHLHGYSSDDVSEMTGFDRTALSHMRLGSKWRKLDFDLISFEATGDDNRLSLSLERTGLWNLAARATDNKNFYDYEQAWWMQQWDLPPAPEEVLTCRNIKAPDANGGIYGILFNLFSGHSDEAETFAQLCRIDFASPAILGHIIDGRDSGIEIPVVRQGREVLAYRTGSSAELAKELQRFCSILRDFKELSDSTKYALRLEQLSSGDNDININTMRIVESSHTAWSQGDQTLALAMLQTIIASPGLKNVVHTSKDVRSLEGDYTLAKVYCRLGSWARLARHESDEVIMQEYFNRAEEYAQEADMEQVHHYFAHFCDEASHDPALIEELESLERMQVQREHELEHLKVAVSETKADRDGINRKLYHVQKALASEAQDLSSLLERKRRLTLKCAESYLRSLRAGDTYSGDVDSFVALWLELVDDVPVNELIYRLLAEPDALIPLTRKFLPWMNQLSSRLAKMDREFQRALQLVISTALQRHPYHTLWQLINLYWSGVSTDVASMERKGAAKAIMERVRNRKQRSQLLRDMSACAKHMLTLMKIPVDKKSSSLSLRELSTDADRWWRREYVKMGLPVPTSTISPREDGDYSSVPTVVSVGSDVKIAGGLSSPKILSFVDSAGVTSHMVLKHGTDDLRQDAIMQQVFHICNDLLATAKGRSLRVRTYNVLPLSPAGGAIEFVEGTRSLQEVLEPLHKKYGGQEEYTIAQARGIMRDVQRGDRAMRIGAFKEVMAHTLPQMRRLWPNRMPDVDRWLAAKTAWSRSTAAISIVGYVVGLGDRHCSNLLVDTTTGEVVHIDLGIAFDQGRLLSVPETVPFRLTREIVDGMGVCGVSGPFTPAARTTLALVREQQSRIMTVLEVLKHDMLYSWRLPPLRVKRVKASYADNEQLAPEVNAAAVTTTTTTGQAESALRGVKQKLSSSLSVEATVRDLVARARDTSNLAVMFCGWSPFY